MPIWRHAWFAVVAATMFLQACGGGSSTPSNTNSNTINPGVATSALRVRVQSDSGVPVAFATVTWSGQQVTTNAQGVLEFDGSPAAGDVVNVSSAGYEPGIMRLAAAQEDVVVVLTTRVTTATLDVATGGTVQVSGSVAQVNLPANGLVLNGTTTAATGKATVSITPIDPSADSSAMPGSYLLQTNAGAVPIESFGAIRVSLENASGQRLNLAAGKKATIRIPVASRSSAPPATIPLLYLDEATGLWQEEGSATLKGTAPNQYYEGDVAHFTFWNADRPLETVWIDGCLVDAKNQPVANAQLLSDGLDYSGQSSTTSDAQGRFRVAMRKSSMATLSLPSSTTQYLNEQVGNYTQNSSLTTCLVVKGISAQVAIVQQPTLQSLGYGRYAASALATGPGTIRYQWQVNGVDVPWAQSSRFSFSADAEDYVDGAEIQVRASNGASSVISNAVVFRLDVADTTAPIMVSIPSPVTIAEGSPLFLDAQASGLLPMRYQWLRDGVPITGATGKTLLTFNSSSADAGTYRVRISNDQGELTSEPWVVSVVPVSPTLGPLMLQLLDLSTAGNITFVSPDNFDAVLAAGGELNDMCASGSATGTLDGSTLFTEPTAGPTHTLNASFNQCSVPDLGSLFNGQVVSAFSYTGDFLSGFSQNTTSTLTNFSTQSDGAIFNGGITVAETGTVDDAVTNFTQAITFANGAKVTGTNSLGDLILTGGTIRLFASQDDVTGVGTLTQQYDNLRFSHGGQNYVMVGSASTQLSAQNGAFAPSLFSGELVLKSNGVTQARMYGNARGQIVFEIEGVVVSSSSLTR